MKTVISIYRLFFSLLIAFLIGLLFIRINGNADSNEIVKQKYLEQKIDVKTLNKEFEDEIINIIEENDAIVINFENDALFQNTKSINAKYKTIPYDQVTDFKIVDSIGYFLIGNLIFTSKIDEENLELEEISDLNNYGIDAAGIEVYNDIIYAYGEMDNNACVFSITLDDEEINNLIVGGSQNETFLDAFILNEQLYLIGQKDSISYSSDLQNVGLPNTEKIFMLSYDLELEERINQLYFNERETSEKYLKYYLEDDHFYLQLDSVIFKIDQDLNLMPQEFEPTCDNDQNYYLVKIKNQIKILKNKNNKLFLDDNYLTDIIGNIALININKGNLELYTTTENILNYYQISEYHINKNEKVISTRYYSEINFVNKLIIDSYFENLKIKISGLNPNLPKNIDGEYDLIYKITKEDETSFLINGKYELKPFVNIVDGGIYPVHKELLFYGNATLNDEVIYNGYKIKEEGSYELKITNANNKEKIYHLKTIENYYKDDECVTISPDIVVNKNTNFKININYNANENTKIKEIWINDSKHQDFKIENKQITINLKSDSKYSIKNYHIDKIVYEDKTLKEYLINQNYLVMTLKDDPTIVMEKIIKDQKITLNYEFDDPDKTFSYLKTELYNGNDLVGINYNYFNKAIKIINLDLKKITCKHYLVSYNGNKMTTTLLMEYEIENYNYNKFLESTFTVEHQLNALNIEINPSQANLISLSANNNNLIKDLKITDNNLNPIIIIIISGVIIGVGIIIFILIKTKILQFKNKKETIKSK